MIQQLWSWRADLTNVTERCHCVRWHSRHYWSRVHCRFTASLNISLTWWSWTNLTMTRVEDHQIKLKQAQCLGWVQYSPLHISGKNPIQCLVTSLTLCLPFKSNQESCSSTELQCLTVKRQCALWQAKMFRFTNERHIYTTLSSHFSQDAPLNEPASLLNQTISQLMRRFKHTQSLEWSSTCKL